MIYDLSDPFELQSFNDKCKWLREKSKKVELKEKRNQQSIPQNSYLHVILQYGANHCGYTLTEFKQIFKTIICEDEFKYGKDLPNGKKLTFYKSSRDFDTLQTTNIIEKYRNYMSSNFGLYIPAPNETDQILNIRNKMSQYGTSQYL